MRPFGKWLSRWLISGILLGITTNNLFAATDFNALKNSEFTQAIEEKQHEIQNSRNYFHKHSVANWYDEYYYHADLVLESYVEGSLGFHQAPEENIENVQLYTLIGEIIKYRKLVSNDTRQLTPEAYECTFGDPYERRQYISAFLGYDTNKCISSSKLFDPYQRYEALHEIISMTLPEVENSIEFAKKNNIVSTDYLEGDNWYRLMNNAELAKITSGLLDYIWEKRDALNKVKPFQHWYDEYFEYLDDELSYYEYYYEMSNWPDASVKAFEIYKTLIPMIRAAKNDWYHYFSKEANYVCEDLGDFMFDNEIYAVDFYNNDLSQNCKDIDRNKAFTRIEAVDLLTHTLFKEAEDPVSFGVFKGFFSPEYLSSTNRDKVMNHAEFAKISSLMLQHIIEE